MELRVITQLAFRNLLYRPWRSAMLLFGYGLGVGVMIVLLAIGEALLTQARDEKLVGGGAITVLPEGLDVEVMKTGGVGGLYFSIDRARFVYRQLLAAPRLSGAISAVAPQIEGKLLYLHAGGSEYAVRAGGEVPSRTRAVRSELVLTSGAWADDEGDRRWISPAPRELYGEIDRFHETPKEVTRPESWAEWHYFNVLSSDRRRWAYISFIIGGDVPEGEWGGQVLISVREEGRATRMFRANVRSEDIRYSTTSPDLVIGASSVALERDGRYVLRVRAREEGGSASLVADLVVTPAPRAYFPGATLAECEGEDGGCQFTSGYAVAALRADASGTLCIAGDCEQFVDAQSYHDHNWGVWRGVTWEWGASRAGEFTFLYGRVKQTSGVEERALGVENPLILYLVDSLGFRALFRPKQIVYAGMRRITVDGKIVDVPTRAELSDVRGGDTLRITIAVEDAIATDTRRPLLDRGDQSAARALSTPYFIQMKGIARLTGRVGGKVVSGSGTGFFETYR